MQNIPRDAGAAGNLATRLPVFRLKAYDSCTPEDILTFAGAEEAV